MLLHPKHRKLYYSKAYKIRIFLIFPLGIVFYLHFFLLQLKEFLLLVFLVNLLINQLFLFTQKQGDFMSVLSSWAGVVVR